jgi:hypothetical protein
VKFLVDGPMLGSTGLLPGAVNKKPDEKLSSRCNVPPSTSPITNDAMTRERLIELYKAELLQAFDEIGDDFDLYRGDVDFTADGAVICGEAEILPAGTIDTEHLAGYL